MRLFTQVRALAFRSKSTPMVEQDSQPKPICTWVRFEEDQQQ
ncbi:hypothetical protein T261_7058 [Streptomyces lydicus]|nr:hypothetical protein T261_7058 [Streptomyces lydicus]